MSVAVFSDDIFYILSLHITCIRNHGINHLATALMFGRNVDIEYSIILDLNVGIIHVADICVGAWTQSG
jgi:hypothetical protein